ncbi:MAG: class I SAM-dependent methyltransferase [Alphaproteobacteria bacterium]|nr:class I SAM-dependent methyltransferase [Alphaproteobacteria bacterium]
MEFIIYSIYTITLILLILFNIYIYHALFSSKFGKYPPFAPTIGKRKKIILDKISEILKKSEKQITFLDAGSGTGTIIIPLAKKFPQHKFVGIEWTFYPYFISKLKSGNLKNIELIHGDMFKSNFKEVDILYCFIVENFKKPLSEKILSEMKKDSIVIANGSHFETMEIVEEVKFDKEWLSNSIYFYRLK